MATESIKNEMLQVISGSEMRQTIYVGISGFTILVWDHIITSADEIELIWKQPKRTLSASKKAHMSGLMFQNRYLTPLVFIVNLVVSPVTSTSIYPTFMGLHSQDCAASLDLVNIVQVAVILFDMKGPPQL
ncbi:hypothetical protein EV424DRAFT_1346944 [Suillus variegatus]|nr:hypothetical protein EV424DRAFT_1346944 [Suillus variegatus]